MFCSNCLCFCLFQVQDWQEQMVFPEAAILIFAWLNVNKMKNKISVYVLKWENEKAPVCMHTHSHMLTGAHSRTPTPVDRQWQISLLSDWTRNHPNSKHWFTTSFLQPLLYLVTPQGAENCRLTSSFFCWCSNSSRFVTNNWNKTRRVIYSRQQSLHQHKSRQNSLFYPGWMRLMFTCVLWR